MLSLETAKSLKEAGLKWEPKMGDLFVADYQNGLGPTPVDVVKTNNFGDPGPEHIWLPHLDQMLAEMEKRGYNWILEKTKFGLYLCSVQGPLYSIHQYNCPEEAAAQALLWILKADLQRALK